MIRNFYHVPDLNNIFIGTYIYYGNFTVNLAHESWWVYIFGFPNSKNGRISLCGNWQVRFISMQKKSEFYPGKSQLHPTSSPLILSGYQLVATTKLEYRFVPVEGCHEAPADEILLLGCFLGKNTQK